MKQGLSDNSGFDVNAALKLVPIFKETEVAEFFIAFEKIANQLKWPRERWTTLVQCKFVGKAQKVYVTLSEEVSRDYDQVKSLILKSYELIPEAYRQKFRELRKLPQQSYVEFALLKSLAFDEWCRSKEVDDCGKRRELVLVEEFKQCVSREIKVFLEENHADILEEAAKKADEYALSHKSYFRSRLPGFGVKTDGYGEKGKLLKSSPPKGKKGSPPKQGNRDIECYYCHKKGHIKSDCILLKKKKAVSLVSRLGRDEDSFGNGLGTGHGLEGYRAYTYMKGRFVVTMVNVKVQESV